MRIRIMIGCNLEQFRWVLQPVDLIQNNPLARQTVEKALGVEHHLSDARQFAVEILDVREALAQARLSDSTNPSDPDYRAVLPRLFEQT
ncbi:MAG: hypothetical protein DMG90_11310 [Acidobacteria bacterium]|nr:MAG: hypothetical protein DMG90_11310 [Acidobacteriota bacterium]